MAVQRIAVLGSTGSIGRQSLEIIKYNRDQFGEEVITANDYWQLLVNPAIEFSPACVVIANESYYHKVQQA